MMNQRRVLIAIVAGLAFVGCGKRAPSGPTPVFVGKWQMDREQTRKVNSWAGGLSGGIRYVFNVDGRCIEGLGQHDTEGKWKVLKEGSNAFTLELVIGEERYVTRTMEVAVVDADRLSVHFAENDARGDKPIHLKRVAGDFTRDEPNAEAAVIKPRVVIDAGLKPNAVAISGDGKLVAAYRYGEAKNLQVWDVEKKVKVNEFDVKTKTGSQVALSPDGGHIAYAVGDYYRSQVYVRQVTTGKELHHFDADGSARGLAFTADGKQILVGIGTSILGRDAATGAERFTWETDQKILSMSQLFEAEKKVASLDEKGTVSIWEIGTGKSLQTFKAGDKARHVGVSGDGKWLVVGYSSEHPKLWELRNGKEGRSLLEASPLSDKLLFLPDGKTVVYDIYHWKGLDGKHTGIAVGVEDIEAENVRAILAEHFGGLGGMALTPDGKTLVTGGAHDAALKIWDLTAVP